MQMVPMGKSPPCGEPESEGCPPTSLLWEPTQKGEPHSRRHGADPRAVPPPRAGGSADTRRLTTCSPRTSPGPRPVSQVGQGCGARGNFWGEGSLCGPTAMSREPQAPVDSFKKQNPRVTLISTLHCVNSVFSNCYCWTRNRCGNHSPGSLFLSQTVLENRCVFHMRGSHRSGPATFQALGGPAWLVAPCGSWPRAALGKPSHLDCGGVSPAYTVVKTHRTECLKGEHSTAYKLYFNTID